MRRIGVLVVVWSLTACVVAAADVAGIDRLERALVDAARGYDSSRVTQVLSEVRRMQRAEQTPATAELHVRAALAVAELLRIEFEESASSADRRVLGMRIDATAEEALALLTTLPPSSESERMRADLIATMIRSDFRARKYEADFERAVAAALELDPGNARAWVSRAKPFLFAGAEHGGDVREAKRLLDHALELDPGLESARLLRALAHRALGETAAARADWRRALADNPDCLPARRGLDELGSDPG